MIRVLLNCGPNEVSRFAPHIAGVAAEAGLKVELSEDWPPETVDYIVLSPDGPVQDYRPFTRAKAALSLWAGVNAVVGNETLTLPLARMVERGMTQGMVEYVTTHVMRHHTDLDGVLADERERRWSFRMPPLASEREVGILGLGQLGSAAAVALSGLGFRVSGWARSEKEIAGVSCLSGQDGFRALLGRSEILVTLLPLTAETENTLDAAAFAAMREGAAIINPGRGALIDDAALLTALDAGRVGHATLDVFREEPLPDDHPYWSHPGVTVTPHMASATRPATSAETIVENIRRGEAGEPFLYLVDRARGY